MFSRALYVLEKQDDWVIRSKNYDKLCLSVVKIVCLAVSQNDVSVLDSEFHSWQLTYNLSTDKEPVLAEQWVLNALL